MSLSRYKNTVDILNSTKPISGKFFTNSQIKLLSPTVIYPDLDIEKFLPNASPYSKKKVEFHVYSLDGAYISGTQFTTNYQAIGNENIFFDIQQDFNELGLLSGNYKFAYNVLLDHVGSFSTERLFVFDISNSRTELILKLENPDNLDSIKELESFFKYWISESRYFINSCLNFGRNNLISIANIASDRTQNTIYIKLFEPLPAEFSLQSTCWISEILSAPYIDSIQIIPVLTERPTTTLRGPNFDVEKLYWRHLETDYKNWTELTSTNVDLNELVTTNFFRKKYGIKLNIDFSDLSNFIFYSSLEERILNFIYKVELITWYQEQIDTIASLNATYDNDLLVYSNSKRAILNSFDDFEVFLYYGKNTPTSEGSSYKIPPAPKTIVDGILTNIRWITWAQTWINALVIWKIASSETSGFAIIDINSPEWAAWKESAVATAKEFDLQNEAQLIKTIPDFIKEDPNNSQYLLFVNMIAHYFDTIWIYARQFNERYSKLEHPELGVSKDLIGGIIKNLGWTLNDSQKFKDLWSYLFGLSEENKLIKSSVLNSELVLSGKDYTKALWKRIFMNLSAITKSKGTYRSISALLSTYGIPTSDFFVREFGGPSNTDTRPKYQEEKSTAYITVNKNENFIFPFKEFTSSLNEVRYPNSIYTRFIPDKETFQVNSTVVLSKNGKINVLFNRSGSNEYTGNIILEISSSAGIISSSINNIEYVDEIPTILFLQTGNEVSSSLQTDTLNLYILQKKYEKVNLFESTSIVISGSYVDSLLSVDDISLFSETGSKYYLNEFRYWKSPIKKEIMESHTLSPLSYHGSDIYESSDNLLARYSPWIYNAYISGSPVYNLKPYTIGTIINESSYYASTNCQVDPTSSFYYSDEYVRFEIPTIGDNGILPEKERLERMFVSPNLSSEVRSEFSLNDFKDNDSNKIKIGYSPQFNINEDIYGRFGTFELDEFIGSTIDNNKKYYTSLYGLAEFYYKNSKTTNDIHGYLKALKIYDFSIFDQIRQVLPAKANAIMGIIIENNELQRIKLKTSPVIDATVQDADKIELLRSSTKTLTFNPISSGIIKKINEIDVNVQQISDGNIQNIPVVKNNFISLNSKLSVPVKINSSFNSKTDFTSEIRISGLFGNQIDTKNVSFRVSNFSKMVPYNYISSSYTASIIGGQLGYESVDISENLFENNAVVSEPSRGYYGYIKYNYNNDSSHSIRLFSSAEIRFGNNKNFVKRVHKGAENHRYLGSKLIANDINVLTLTLPAENAAFVIANIPSGSDSVVLTSLATDTTDIVFNQTDIPAGV